MPDPTTPHPTPFGPRVTYRLRRKLSLMAQGDYDYKQPPPPPPEDLQEQSEAVRHAAELAALALFVNAVMNSDEPTGADVHLVRSIFGNLVKGIATSAISSAGQSPGRRRGELLSLSTIVDSLVTRLSAPNSPDVSELLNLVRRIRQSNRKAPARDPGELSLARESARNFATWAYGRAIEAVAPAIQHPEWLSQSFGLKKIWITQGDSRVRPLHRRLHGKVVRWDKDFWRWPQSGHSLRFPGDPHAPLDAVIGCRCLCFLSFAKAEQLAPMVRPLPLAASTE